MAFCHTRAMKRTTIWLTDSQVAALAKLSKKTGTKQAELIRRFIDKGIERRTK
jgi:predicted DNA-binding protein